MTTYVNRKDSLYLETVDEFETLKEAKEMVREYQFGDPAGRYYVSSRCTRDWWEQREETRRCLNTA